MSSLLPKCTFRRCPGCDGQQQAMVEYTPARDVVPKALWICYSCGLRQPRDDSVSLKKDRAVRSFLKKWLKKPRFTEQQLYELRHEVQKL